MNATRMHLAAGRPLLVTILMIVAAMGCSPAQRPPDYAALEAEIEKAITTGPATLDNVRAVLISVDGETKIAHYRHGFTQDDHRQVFSVTKSVVSILIGMAIADGLIGGLDQPLAELLPEHRQAMRGDTANVTLRQLMTMSGGFVEYFPKTDEWVKSAEPGGDYVDLLLTYWDYPPGRIFRYSNPSANLAAAVLAAALERADGEPARTILDYAREKLFDPLGISTRPDFSGPLPDLTSPELAKAGFAWGTDPNGIHLGAAGLRLTAPDMIKIGELYRRDGMWNDRQIVPADWIRQSTSPSALNPDYGLFWWLLGEPEGPGYTAAGAGGQHITVLPASRAVIVYLCEMQPDNEISAEDVKPLHQVFATAFP